MIVAIIVLAWELFVSMVINFTYFAYEGIDKKEIIGLLLMMFFPPYFIGWVIFQIVMAIRYRRAIKRREKEEREEEDE